MIDNTPKCFNNHVEWMKWREAAAVEKPIGFGYCSDCCPSYQAKMLPLGRCEHPEVYFEVYEGDYIGRKK